MHDSLSPRTAEVVINGSGFGRDFGSRPSSPVHRLLFFASDAVLAISTFAMRGLDRPEAFRPNLDVSLTTP
jgi:hypothetical protein